MPCRNSVKECIRGLTGVGRAWQSYEYEQHGAASAVASTFKQYE